jgi:hypothetical protein
MRSVSSKETTVLTERCYQCGLYYEYLHPTPGGSYLCRTCLELSGLNRARWPR